MFKDILISMRPQQIPKNLALLAALIFSRNFFDPSCYLKTLAAILLFTFVSGGVYLLNDACDVEADRAHPDKKNRPLASGRLDKAWAEAIAAVILVWALALSYLLSPSFSCFIALYIGIELAYTFWLKNVVIVDVFCIASGFMLRVLSGAAVISVPVSSWFLICTIFLSLFLALAKRRNEIVVLGPEAATHRAVLREYSLGFLDQLIMVVTACSILSYALYTLSPETVAKFGSQKLEFTIPFVVYGVFRYLYLVYQKKLGGAPEKILFTDKPTWINLIFYVATVLAVIYL